MTKTALGKMLISMISRVQTAEDMCPKVGPGFRWELGNMWHKVPHASMESKSTRTSGHTYEVDRPLIAGIARMCLSHLLKPRPDMTFIKADETYHILQMTDHRDFASQFCLPYAEDYCIEQTRSRGSVPTELEYRSIRAPSSFLDYEVRPSGPDFADSGHTI